MNRFETVDEYIYNHPQWEKSLILLRETVVSTKLEETIKWGNPVYTFRDKNVVGIAAFKSYVGLWFFQGALLNDKKKKLINAQDEVTKAQRQWRFNSVEEIRIEIEIIKEYINEAISNQEQGKQVKTVKNKPLNIPAQLLKAFTFNSGLKTCFEAFSLTKRREFAEYIEQAKTIETKQIRLARISDMILAGEGLNDKYRK